MVSRSLEKMMLIAIGLSSVVIVGVPVLLFAIDTISTTSQLQDAQFVATQVHNATGNVDTGVTNMSTISIWVNSGITIEADGNTLTVTLSENGVATRTWSETYSHVISIDAPLPQLQRRALFSMEVILVDDVIHISFLAAPI